MLLKLKFALLPLLFLSSNLSRNVEGKNILFFWGFATYSHRIAVWPLVEKLVDLGHNVTFLSPHPPKSLANPKVTEVIPKSLVDASTALHSNSNLLGARLAGVIENIWYDVAEFAVGTYESLAKDPEFLEFYENSDFDLVFVDSLYSEFGYGIAHKSKAQLAIMCSCAPYVWFNDIFGMPSETSWLPDIQWHYPEEMSLYQRIWNTYSAVYWDFYRSATYYPRMEKIFRETLGLKDLPGFKDLEKNVSLVLTNTHFGEEYARSMPPLVVSVGGMHCYLEKKETPKDLELFMNSTGSNGFFYVSFGTANELHNLPAELRNTFFNAMSNSKTKFLLKWSGEVPPEMPKNAFTVSWVPQQNVLSHPNIKGFITHGGLLGIQEAVVSGVPMIVMPIFADQDFNANRVHNRRRGIKLELTTLTQADLEKAISSLLTDPSYKQNMLRASKLFLDRPQKPQDLAVWWTEYILRHGSVDEMKPLGIHQTWYQRRLVDVSFAVFLVLLLPLLGIFLLYRKCIASSKKDLKAGQTKKHS